MMITLLLDKKKQYHMNDLTLREKIALMEELMNQQKKELEKYRLKYGEL